MYSEANVTLMVQDLDRSIQFYVDTVGFQMEAQYGPYWAQVTGPGIRIGLHPGGDSSSAKSDTVSLGLMVNDFQLAVDGLRSKGVEFDRITEEERASSAYFVDPDGYWLYVMHRQDM